MANGIVDAGGTDQLTYNDTFRAVDHKSTGLCHQGKVTHKNLMFTDFFFFFIIEAYRYRQRRRVGGVPLLAFLDGILHVLFAQIKVDKFKTQ